MSIGKTVLWTCTSLRNMVIMFEACKGLGISPEVIFYSISDRAKNLAEDQTGKSWSVLVEEHTHMLGQYERGKFPKPRKADGGEPNLYLTELEEVLTQIWVTLDEFNRIQRNFKGLLGHLSYLREIGHYAPKTAMGGAEAYEFKLLRRSRFLIDPFLVFVSIVFGSGIFVHNKAAVALRAYTRTKRGKARIDNGACYVCYRFVDGPNGVSRRTIHEDYESLLSYIPGIGESVLGFWPSMRAGVKRWIARLFYPIQDHVGNITIPVAPMALSDLLEAESRPDWKIETRQDHTSIRIRTPGMIDFQTVGEVVTLVASDFPGELEGRYLGGEDYLPGSHPDTGPVGIRLTQDILTPCTRTGAMLPIAFEGQIFAPEAPETVMRARWQTHPLLSPIIRRITDSVIAGKMDAFRETLRHEKQTAVFASQAQSTQATMTLQTTERQKKFPTPKLGDAVMQDLFPGHRNQCGVIVADVRGYTRATQAAEQAGEGETFSDMIAEFHDRVRTEVANHAGWVYYGQGDQVIAIFTSDWGIWGPSQALQDHLSDEELYRGQVETARAIAAIALEYDLFLRIALHYGDVKWTRTSIDKIDGAGGGINVCAHLENIGLRAHCATHTIGGTIIGMTEAFVDQAYPAERARGRIPVGLESPRAMHLKDGNIVSVYVMSPETIQASETSTQSVIISGIWTSDELGTETGSNLPDDITGAFPAFIPGLDDDSLPKRTGNIPVLGGSEVDPFLIE